MAHTRQETVNIQQIEDLTPRVNLEYLAKRMSF